MSSGWNLLCVQKWYSSMTAEQRVRKMPNFASATARSRAVVLAESMIPVPCVRRDGLRCAEEIG